MRRVNVRQLIRIHGVGIGVVVTVAAVTAVIASSSCFDTKTTVCEKAGLRCEPGQICDVAGDACIPIGGCGDGVVSDEKEPDGSPKEVCDDGNVTDGDGCSADCKSNETCGNHITDTKIKTPESCDDGSDNGTPRSPCSINCVLAACGNGVKDVNEECDPGLEDSPGCNSSRAGSDARCKFRRCGDGYTNAAAGEQCDDGPAPSATCNSPILCTSAQCGDGYYNHMAGEECDTGGDTQACNGSNNGSNGPANCSIPQCGDNYTNTAFTPLGASQPEECDAGSDTQACNGNNHGSNGIGSCRKPACGDGYVNGAFTPAGATQPEECDAGKTGSDTKDCNGNNHGSNGIGSCRKPACGDGYFNSMFVVPDNSSKQGHNEQCDDGQDTSNCNGNGNPSGIGNCMHPQCGDGYINPMFTPPPKFSWPRATPGEECDDGSANNDSTKDACRTDCRKHFCGDGVKDTGEACDKGDPPGKPETGCGNLHCNSDCTACGST